MYWVVPRLWSLCADYEEAVALMSVKGYTCPECLVSRKDLGTLFPSVQPEKRTVGEMRSMYEMAERARTSKESKEICDAFGISPAPVRNGHLLHVVRMTILTRSCVHFALDVRLGLGRKLSI